MLRWLRPRRIVEVGSGHSSALMLDTADERAWPIKFLFIEPYPDRLKTLLRTSDAAHEILPVPVQDVLLSRFDALESGDILFIDSSHVAKVGSDVVWLLEAVLPALHAGVVVHIHDIFWPFEYPEVWLRQGRAWNEAYFVRAFLQFNSAFEILWFTSYLTTCHRERVAAKMPLLLRDHGGSLWLRKRT
jgi:predicted O-methyltransferase YrrM